MFRRLKFADPIIVIGFTVSISLSTLLYISGIDNEINLIIGLLSTILTLLIDQIFRTKETEHEFLLALRINEKLLEDPQLRRMIDEITSHYQAIGTYKFNLFRDRAIDLLQDTATTLRNMADGHMVVPHRTKFTYGRNGVRDAKKSIKATVYMNPSYFRTSYGEAFIETNQNAVKKGVDVTRIWIQKLDTLRDYQDIIKKQKSVGMKVYVASTDKVPANFLEDYLIVDEKVLVVFELDRDGLIKSERISVNSREIHEMLNNFDLLTRHATDIDAMLADTDP